MLKHITNLRGIAKDKDVYIFGRGFSYSLFPFTDVPKDAITMAVNARNMMRVYDYNIFTDKAYFPYASILHKQIVPKGMECPFGTYGFEDGMFNGTGVAALWIVQNIFHAKCIHMIGFDMVDHEVEPGKLITHGDTMDYAPGYDYENMIKGFKAFQWDKDKIINHCPYSKLDFS